MSYVDVLSSYEILVGFLTQLDYLTHVFEKPVLFLSTRTKHSGIFTKVIN